ncbi:MAG TPA: HAD family phosphatase [Candidatus Limnocylindria bacterium]|nr:HAD family phosphatase [Candidatus Limnocylindria bacterium]
MIRAVLLDFDGTLVDTERLQWTAYEQALAPFGVHVGLDEYRRHFIRAAGGSDWVCRRYALPVAPDELRARKAAAYRALIPAGVRPCAGAGELLQRLAGRRLLAVVTNSVRAEVDVILAHLGWTHGFDAVIAREDYVHAKPAPDGYLVAAARLGCAPHECVVVEDTERGVRAGLAAGMRVVAVPSDLTYDNDFSGCVRRLDSLTSLTETLLDQIDRDGCS